MKTLLKYLVMAVMSMGLMTACHDDENVSGKQESRQPVQFNMNLNQSRTVTGTDNNRTTKWSEGDAVGIFVCKHGTQELVYTNAKYVLSGGFWSAADEESKIYSDEAYDFYAYYPYASGVTDPKSVAVTALSDQTTADNYAQSDFLAAQNTAVDKNATTVSLTFSHLFSMVEVKISGDNVLQKPTKVTLNNVKLVTTVDLTAATPAATVTDGTTAGNVEMYYLEKTENADVAPFVFRAVVPAQEIAAETSLVTIENPSGDGKSHYMQYSEAVTYEAGKCRQINVSVNKAKVTLSIPDTDFSFNPWGTSDEISGKGEEVPVSTLSLDLTTDTEFKALGSWGSKNLISETSDTWFTRFATDSNPATYTLTEEDGVTVINLTMAAESANGWNKNALGFHSTGTFALGVYKLTYQIQATNASAETPVAGGIVIRTADDKSAFRISKVKGGTEDSDKTAQTFTLKDATVATGSPYVDFSKKCATITSNAMSLTAFSDAEESDVKGINIYLYCNTKGATLSFKNIKLEKVD